jgi:hypothetical protein
MSRFIQIKNFLFPVKDIRALYVKDKTMTIIPMRPYKNAEYLNGDNWRFYRNCSEIDFSSRDEARVAFDFLSEELDEYQ